MDSVVFGAVLFAAACHAGWNALIKFGLDPFTTTALIAVGSGVIAAPLIAFIGLPPLEAWPWVAASVALHLAYYLSLTEAYRSGDMGQVYPIARGSAPLMTAVASIALVGETLGTLGFVGIAVLALGIILMSLRGGKGLANMERRAVLFALATAVTICGYSLVDGIGARVSGSAHSYSVALFACDGLMMLMFALARRGHLFMTAARQYWAPTLFGGALSLAAYWIAIWAMTQAPIALVAALRESSVLFAAVISVVILREPLRGVRVFAAIAIVIGLGLIRLH